MQLNAAATNPTPANETRHAPMVTVEQVAEVLRMHPVYVRRLFTGGRIPGAVRFGRVWRLPADKLAELVRTGLPSCQ